MAGNPTSRNAPWWRFGIVWLVFAGPTLVVAAALGTAVVAFRTADVVVTAPVVAHAPADDAEVPALAARNRGAAPARKP